MCLRAKEVACEEIRTPANGKCLRGQFCAWHLVSSCWTTEEQEHTILHNLFSRCRPKHSKVWTECCCDDIAAICPCSRYPRDIDSVELWCGAVASVCVEKRYWVMDTGHPTIWQASPTYAPIYSSIEVSCCFCRSFWLLQKVLWFHVPSFLSVLYAKRHLSIRQYLTLSWGKKPFLSSITITTTKIETKQENTLLYMVIKPHTLSGEVSIFSPLISAIYSPYLRLQGSAVPHDLVTTVAQAASPRFWQIRRS